ncbi:hypothetical protein QUF64_16280 [Anaerolineales bacterium HSG6]|nr:hypothetical protein [Anaerolineales bacterium HSG6]MDM8532197.1 hypothetical protein [Anaerolineales bacterium HSG25]
MDASPLAQHDMVDLFGNNLGSSRKINLPPFPEPVEGDWLRQAQPTIFGRF